MRPHPAQSAQIRVLYRPAMLLSATCRLSGCDVFNPGAVLLMETCFRRISDITFGAVTSAPSPHREEGPVLSAS